MKYLKPNASGTQRAVHDLGEGEVTSAIILTFGLAGAVFGIPLIFINSLFFLLLILPLAVLWMIVVEERSTVEIGHRNNGDPLLTSAEKYMTSIRGSGVEFLAKPMYIKIFEHAQIHNKNHIECTVCAPRLLALENLLPTALNYQNDSDIRQVLDFLQMRKELGE